MIELQRRLVAEALGTAMLLIAVVGSGIMAERLADGSVGLALLCNTFPVAAILYVFITLLGPISGAHFNPAVTLAFLLRREISAKDSVAFIVMQILGGIAGTMAAHIMFGLPALMNSGTERTGMNLWFSEGVATFGLVFVILAGVAKAPRAIPALVGLYIAGAYWFTASTSFANPAVTIARSLTDSFSGILPAHAPAFIAAQLIGAVIAVPLAQWLFAERQEPAADLHASPSMDRKLS